MYNHFSISSLTYEELVLLQEIMMDVIEHGVCNGRADYDIQDFDSLNSKIMSV